MATQPSQIDLPCLCAASKLLVQGYLMSSYWCKNILVPY